MVGIDVIPAQPPRGVSALQGDFLSEGVQGLVREFVREWRSGEGEEGERELEEEGEVRSVVERARGSAVAEESRGETSPLTSGEGDAETEALPAAAAAAVLEKKTPKKAKKLSQAALDLQQGRVVDVVLSDMCAPFPGLELSSWINSINRPYRRMMNTSGNPFRDHAGSIVRCADLFIERVGIFALTRRTSGSVHGSTHILSRLFDDRRPFLMQILPRTRRQGSGESDEEAF